MRGRKKTYVVTVTESERQHLQHLISARTSPRSEAQRAQIVVTCADHPDWSDGQVAASIPCSSALVRKWRKRWQDTRSLKEAPRSGRPRVFAPEVRAQLTALAGSLPTETGIPLARWSCAELASMLVTLGVVVSIAASTVWRWMQAEQIKPWRFRLWQRSRDPHFLERATAVLQLYAQANSLLAQGIWVVCADEKTSIQAREGVDPPHPPQALAAGRRALLAAGLPASVCRLECG